MTTVLDPKRSNAINIGLTTLPPVHVIKAALLNFDEFAVSKDGIEVGIPSGRYGREAGSPALFLGRWPFPVPPVVGMGLAFLHNSPQTLGFPHMTWGGIKIKTRGLRPAMSGLCGVVAASSEATDHDAHGGGAAED